jgi:hypothetical protein
VSSSSLASSAALLDYATAPRPVGEGCAHVAERRPDLDSGARTLAYVCARCGAVGHATITRLGRLYWTNSAPTDWRDSESRARIGLEKKLTKEGWRP